MRHVRTMCVALSALGLLISASSCLAKVEVGDPAPDFSNLEGVDDQTHSLSDYDDAKAIVLVFTCNHCPVAKAYEDRLIDLQDDYADEDVQVIGLNVNNLPADRLDQMKIRAEEKGFNFPYVYDPSQESAKEYGATCTPHVFILGPERHVVYIGAIDDNMDPEKVEQQYVRDVLDAVLAGEQPEVTETKAVGCSIKWD